MVRGYFRNNYSVGANISIVDCRYVAGLVAICDLLDFGPDNASRNLTQFVPKLREQAEILTNKLAPGYVSRESI